MAKVKPVKEKKEFEERIIQVRRVTKVVKGGKNLSFRCLVVIGDKKGKVGVGLGKAREVAEAVRKALEQAKKSLVTVPIVRGTVPHRMDAKYKAVELFLAPASAGTGILAGGSVRAVLELAGYTDVLTKLKRSTNPVGAVYGTFEALQAMRTSESVSLLRGKTVFPFFMPRTGKQTVESEIPVQIADSIVGSSAESDTSTSVNPNKDKASSSSSEKPSKSPKVSSKPK